MNKGKKKILVHACCAACASFAALELEKDNLDIALFFYNPNYNHLEYHYRLTGIRGLAKRREFELLIPPYNEEDYQLLIVPFQDRHSIKYIADRERFARRAREVMITLILEKLQQAAIEGGHSYFTTSMLCSPYRDHNTIWDVGLKKSLEQSEFYYKDLRKGYWMGRKFAEKYNFAIPAYCSDYLEQP